MPPGLNVEYSFTHHDPLEDTESQCWMVARAAGSGFTHHDPLEDTERAQKQPLCLRHALGFTHHDPLEDTESEHKCHVGVLVFQVSPITIRLRILKASGNVV